jgi:DnaJ-class molecular chaperone
MAVADDFIAAWMNVLDDLTYYELFGVREDASPDDLREAFHVFCDSFHPDRHIGRDPEERSALSTIFKRGTEAYLVLSDLGLRARYDAQLDAGPRRPPRMSVGSVASLASMGQESLEPPKLEDSVRSPSARPFARRAEELMNAGDFRQAKLQLVMANHLDPENAALEAALKTVESKLPPSKLPPK